MQRGLEIDVQPSRDVRVLWLGKDRKSLYIGVDKQSISRQEVKLSQIRTIQPSEKAGGSKCVEVVTDDVSILFNVDTQASRDILIRNLIRVVDADHENHCNPPASHGPTSGFSTGGGMHFVLFTGSTLFFVGFLGKKYGMVSSMGRMFILSLSALCILSLAMVGWKLPKTDSLPNSVPTSVSKRKVFPEYESQNLLQTSIHPSAAQAMAPWCGPSIILRGPLACDGQTNNSRSAGCAFSILFFMYVHKNWTLHYCNYTVSQSVFTLTKTFLWNYNPRKYTYTYSSLASLPGGI